ncbi:hypothetical protein [Haloarcula amylovorans]|uniref:hypothetical protein n=1 Tax=Haloarcula amylovorans TaxID=2562280 RepID=UPI001075E86D|nr:hypothetical protein [Halomicroarcula amylolytica]
MHATPDRAFHRFRAAAPRSTTARAPITVHATEGCGSLLITESDTGDGGGRDPSQDQDGSQQRGIPPAVYGAAGLLLLVFLIQ